MDTRLGGRKLTEEDYVKGFPTLVSGGLTYDQWRGAECCGETYVICGGIHSPEPLLEWFYEGCRILTDTEHNPLCVSPCKVTDNYYVSCVYGDWKIHYYSADNRRSWVRSLSDINPSADWRSIQDWEQRVFKVRDDDVTVLKILKQAVLSELSALKGVVG